MVKTKVVVTKKSDKVVAEKKAPKSEKDVVADIDKLLKQLSVEEDKMEKRRIRRNLRNLGHQGGLKNTKFDKA